MLGTFGIKLYFTKYLKNFLDEDIVFGCRKKISAVIGWGYKKKTEFSRQIAQKNNIPYWALEDGFYRSLDLGCRGAVPYSIIVDKTGIYYNSLQSSDLENYLNDVSLISDKNILRARKAIDYICAHNLSKYNHAPDINDDYFAEYSGKEKILVIDQTYHDASVLMSGASENAFSAMIEDALKIPQAQVFVKIHPDVLSGKKQGYLKQYAEDKRVRLIADNFSPLSLLRHMDKVFVVSSQMGFEALLLGKEVHCYGMPFYAGWGLTHDKLVCERRMQKHSVESLFYAACIVYPRYVHPIKKERCELEDILQLLAVQKRCNDQNRGRFVCVGFSYWKYHHARAYLQGTDNVIKFVRDFDKAVLTAKREQAKIVAWASKISSDFEEKCLQEGVPLIRMEDGFLRSVGLGSDFNWPFSLVLDSKGVYYNPQKESDLEYILENFSEREDREILINQAKKLQNIIVSKGLSKYNVGSAAVLKKEKYTTDKRLLLVPGQVEDDASVRTGGGAIQSNLDLLKTVREQNPDACIIYKPHPDVERLNRKGKVSESDALKYADYVVADTNITKLLEIVDEVHTLTSLTGFEALMRNIKVSCYGLPFYAGWGLTQDYQETERRTNRLKLEELIAGTLLLYPKYYAWNETCFCSANDVCWQLLNMSGQKRSPVWARYAAIIREVIRSGF